MGSAKGEGSGTCGFGRVLGGERVAAPRGGGGRRRTRRLEAAAADAGRSALGLGAVRAEPLAVRDRVEADAREVRGVLAVLVLAVAEEERRRVALLAADDAGVVVPGLGLLELRQAELRVRVAGRARERARDVVVAVVRLARARDPAVRGTRVRSSRGGASSPARARGVVPGGRAGEFAGRADAAGARAAVGADGDDERVAAVLACAGRWDSGRVVESGASAGSAGSRRPRARAGAAPWPQSAGSSVKVPWQTRVPGSFSRTVMVNLGAGGHSRARARFRGTAPAARLSACVVSRCSWR